MRESHTSDLSASSQPRGNSFLTGGETNNPKLNQIIKKVEDIIKDVENKIKAVPDVASIVNGDGKTVVQMLDELKQARGYLIKFRDHPDQCEGVTFETVEAIYNTKKAEFDAIKPGILKMYDEFKQTYEHNPSWKSEAQSMLKIKKMKESLEEMKKSLEEIISHCIVGPNSRQRLELNILFKTNEDAKYFLAFDRYFSSQIVKLFGAYVAAKDDGMSYPLEKPLADLIDAVEKYSQSGDAYLESSPHLASSYKEEEHYKNIQGKATILLKAIEEFQKKESGKENAN